MTGVIGVYHGTFGRVALFRTNQPVHEHAHPHVHALLKVEGKDGVYDVSGSPCPITDRKMVLVNPWVPHANWRDVNDPPITILALYLEAGWLARDGSGHVARQPFKRPSGPVKPPVRSLVAKIAADDRGGETPRQMRQMETRHFQTVAACPERQCRYGSGPASDAACRSSRPQGGQPDAI